VSAAVASAVSVAAAELGAAFLVARSADDPAIGARRLPALAARDDVVELAGLVHHPTTQRAGLTYRGGQQLGAQVAVFLR
jgi:hypothetical protein